MCFVRNMAITLFFCFVAQLPPVCEDFSLSRIHYHTHTLTHHTRWDSSESVISPMQSPLPDNTHHSQETDTHATGGIRAHNISKEATADQRFDRAATVNVTWGLMYTLG